MITARLPIHTRGLTMDQRKRLRAAIAKFYKRAKREKWDKPTWAKSSCNYASDQFLHCLARFKLEPLADIEHYDFERTSWHTCTHEEAMYGRMRYPFAWCGQWHWAVRVGHNLIIDWTARQFDPEAPFPAMWTDDRPRDFEDYKGYLVAPGRRYGNLLGNDLVGNDRIPGEEMVLHDARRPRRLREMLSVAESVSRMADAASRSRRPSP